MAPSPEDSLRPSLRLAGIRSTEGVCLIFVSPSSLFVLLYCLFAAQLPFWVKLNERNLPGEFVALSGDNKQTFVKDYENDFTSEAETVPQSALVFICVILPLLMFAAVKALTPPIFGDIRASVYGFACAMATAGGVTNTSKKYVGYLRPLFFANCGYDAG